MLPDADAVGHIIAEIAAAEIMPRFEKLGADDVREKRPGDLVTVADLATERALTEALAGILPDARVVGEESAAADPAVLDALTGAGSVWVIDPIDGTANFAAGIRTFVVMVALVRDGAAVMAWIHDPVTGRTAAAAKGGGAWCAGERLAVANAAAAPRRLGNRQLARRAAGRTRLIDEVFDYRCAGHEYLALASGKAHFAYYNRLHPWDHAAGQLLHSEAGGIGAHLDRSPYSPRETAGGLLLAPDRESWETLRETLIAAS